MQTCKPFPMKRSTILIILQAGWPQQHGIPNGSEPKIMVMLLFAKNLRAFNILNFKKSQSLGDLGSGRNLIDRSWAQSLNEDRLLFCEIFLSHSFSLSRQPLPRKSHEAVGKHMAGLRTRLKAPRLWEGIQAQLQVVAESQEPSSNPKT